MIIKTTKEQTKELLNKIRIPATSHFYWGNWTEKFAGHKNIVLSVKKGKKRKLIKGKMIVVDWESDQDSSGYVIYQFLPNNPDKCKMLIDK